MMEVNLDGLVGPTHNYAGLAFGNVASESNAGSVSNPKKAALQGLEKMRLLHGLGVKQMVMPPQPRPCARTLARLGFAGISDVIKHSPQLLPYLYSASGMWTANAATVAPSADTTDGKVHFTPANLISTSHRSFESAFAAHALKQLFPDERYFTHHAPLPANPLFSDEGAANHMHVQDTQGGYHIYVYGREGDVQASGKFPARYTLAAAQAVARQHGVKRAIFVRQTQKAIDAGVFHNDVIATSNADLVLYHEDAYVDDAALTELPIRAIKIPRAQLSLEDAVRTYLFNSQIVSIPGGGIVWIAPKECEDHAGARAVIASVTNQVHYVDLRESMRNGGGPACLRLRIPLNQAEWDAVHPGAVFTDALYEKLTAWVNAHYRDRLSGDDLRDPQLAQESRAALAELAKIMKLDALYD